MTEQEAVEGMLFLKEKLYNGIFKDRLECLDEAIKALEEIQQYRALGTIEELRVDRDKQIPKKPIEIVGYGMMCPTCNFKYLKMNTASCERCNQKLNCKGEK